MTNPLSEPPAPPARPAPGGSLDKLKEHIGAAAREERAAALDVWLRTLFPAHLSGVSLIAVGGLGRRDCAPYSDLDLVLLHNGTAGIDRIASALWYPIWDARLGLDHSVRTLPEALSVAHDDVKVSLGLLDARHVAGDAALSAELVAAAGDQWRRTAVRLMPQLRELTTTRWGSHGELAFLLEGDLKEASGGLRDVTLLRGIGRAGIADTMRPAVRAANLRLLDTRDALHLAVGRRVDRLVAQERKAVADLLEIDDPDTLLRRVSGDARTVAHAVDDAWRAIDRLRADLRAKGGAA
ncbi:[protein-PII] uridylyltransferase, partial [Actinoplanes sp. NPDC024001]